MARLVHHLDSKHPSWVEDLMRTYGFTIPGAYPIAEYKFALAQIVSFADMDNSTTHSDL